jgi:hypothetical protein
LLFPPTSVCRPPPPENNFWNSPNIQTDVEMLFY